MKGLHVALAAAVVAETVAAGFLTQEYVERFHIKMWKDFKGGFKKTFPGEGIIGSEDHKRMHIFRDNLFTVESLVKKNPGVVYGFTTYSELSPEEFAATRAGKPYIEHPSSSLDTSFRRATPADLALYAEDAATAKLPAFIDRRRDMATSHVKHQGQCSISAAFAVTGVLEGALAGPNREGGPTVLRPLSEQWLLSCAAGAHAPCDCAKPETCSPRTLLAAAKAAGGVVPIEEDYEYSAQAGEIAECRSTEGMTRGAQLVEALTLPDEVDFLRRWVVHRGPFMAAFSAVEEWQLYQEGVVQACDTSAGTNAAGVVIGFGEESGKDYWLVKMSWGSAWATHGIIKLKAGIGCLRDPIGATVDPPKKLQAEQEL